MGRIFLSEFYGEIFIPVPEEAGKGRGINGARAGTRETIPPILPSSPFTKPVRKGRAARRPPFPLPRPRPAPARSVPVPLRDPAMASEP